MPTAGQYGDAWLGAASHERDALRALSEPTALASNGGLTSSERKLAMMFYENNIEEYEGRAAVCFEAAGEGLAEPRVFR